MAKKITPSEKQKKLWDKISNTLNGGGYFMYSVDDFDGCKTPEDVIRDFGVEDFVEAWNLGYERCDAGLAEEMYDCRPGKGGSIKALIRDQKKLSEAGETLIDLLCEIFPEHKEYLLEKMQVPPVME